MVMGGLVNPLGGCVDDAVNNRKCINLRQS